MRQVVRIEVDEAACNGHGLCQVVSPEVYEVNPETAKNEAGRFEVAPELRPAARNGANACPEHAITIIGD
jgi:ferredoxin